MSEKKQLSKSACAKYMQCPFGYDAHYNKKIRPIRTGSALVFGNGIDKALNGLLLKDDKDPMIAFWDELNSFEVGKVVPLIHDWDEELLDPAAQQDIDQFAASIGYRGSSVNQSVVRLLQRIKDNETLTDNQYKLVDYATRVSLSKKAELMFSAYKKQVLPHITKVVNVQKQSGSGFLDATVEWKGEGKIVLDHKTSGKAYANDAVDYSLELTLYAAEEKVNRCAYVVFLKQIKKNRQKICSVCGFHGKGSHDTCNNMDGKIRCKGAWNITILPEAEIQVVHGDITPRMIEVAREVQVEIGRAVESKIFHCNFTQCNNQFGKPCQYKDLKWKGSMEGFEIQGKKK